MDCNAVAATAAESICLCVGHGWVGVMTEGLSHNQ